MRLIIFLFLFLNFCCSCQLTPHISPDNKKIKTISADSNITVLLHTDAVSYEQMKMNLLIKKRAQYQLTRSLSNQQKIAQTRLLFISHLADSIIPYWYGTGWDFNGTTETPGKGKIACGYFITTTLRDMGYKINRYKVAQMPSTGIIKSLVQKKNICYYYNNSFEEFIDKIMSQGPGFYVVGLDNHVGYLYHDGELLYFIHSTFVGKSCVMKEIAKQSSVLASSAFRVTGKISDDEIFLQRWMAN
jgi:hypothetical protein